MQNRPVAAEGGCEVYLSVEGGLGASGGRDVDRKREEGVKVAGGEGFEND